MRILVVDDEPRQRKGFEEMIRSLAPEADVIVARNGEEALALIQKVPVDILFSDIRMPRMNGLELSKNALGICPEIIVILISVYADFDYARSAIDMGVFGYILKPVSLNDVNAILQKAFEKLSMRREMNDHIMTKALDAYHEQVYLKWLNNESSSDEQEIVASSIQPYSVGQLFLFAVNCSESAISREEKTELIGNVIEYLYDELASDKVYILPISNIKNVYLCMVFDMRYNLQNNLGKFCKKAEKEYPIEISAILGDEFTQEKGIQSAYCEIKEMTKYFFYAPFSKLMAQRDFQNSGGNLSLSIRKNFEPVKSALLEADDEEIAEYFNRIFTEFSHKYAEPELFKEILGNLLRQLLEAVSYVLLPEDYDCLQKQIIYIKARERLDVFRSKTYGYLYDLMKCYQQRLDAFTPVRRAVHYIEEHYQDDLSLNGMAERFHYSPSYFSTIFKNETGENYIAYINKIRLSKAVEMMRISDLSNYEIARQMGIQDYKYFSRLFKKYYGISISDFRKNLKNRKN